MYAGVTSTGVLILINEHTFTLFRVAGAAFFFFPGLRKKKKSSQEKNKISGKKKKKKENFNGKKNCDKNFRKKKKMPRGKKCWTGPSIWISFIEC